MTYTPPSRGFRTFVIVWAAQSLCVIGSGMTGFALNVYLAQVLYPAPEQKAELALADLRLSTMIFEGTPPKAVNACWWQARKCSIVCETVNSTYICRL